MPRNERTGSTRRPGDRAMNCVTVAMIGILLTQIPAVEELPFNPDALRDRPRVEVRVREGNTDTVYAGVPLHAVIEDRITGPGKMAALRALSDAVLLIRGADGYQAAVSA